MNLLIVDDSKVMRNVIKNFLLGYFKKPKYSNVNIFEAADGLIAMDNVAKTKVDIMFLDWNMPNMDGEEVVEAVRANTEWDDIYIMMATTEGSKKNVLKAIKKGADGYIVKPFNQEIIYKALNTAMERISPENLA